jgi:hypothetical protein
MFEINTNEVGTLAVTNTESTNGIRSTIYRIDTPVENIINGSSHNWNLTDEQRLELIGALVRHFRANPSFGDVARSSGYPALVD